MKNITNKTLIFYTFQVHDQPLRTANKKNTMLQPSRNPPLLKYIHLHFQPKIRDVLHELPLDYSAKSYHFRFKSEFNEGDEKM